MGKSCMLCTCTQGLNDRVSAYQQSTITLAGDDVENLKIFYPLIRMDLKTYALAVDSIGKEVFTIDEMAKKF